MERKQNLKVAIIFFIASLIILGGLVLANANKLTELRTQLALNEEIMKRATLEYQQAERNRTTLIRMIRKIEQEQATEETAPPVVPEEAVVP